MRTSRSDQKFFDRYTKTLFDNRDRILADPILAGAYSREMRIMVAYTSGGGMLPLGVLVELWIQDQWTHRCEKCQGKVLIHQIGGSPLSGAHVWRGVCCDCGGVVEEGSWSGSGKKFIWNAVVPTAQSRKKWNVSEEFGFEEARRNNPSLKLIDVQGGMSIDTDEGPVDLQMKIDISAEEGPEVSQEVEPRLRATIPLRQVLKYLVV